MKENIPAPFHRIIYALLVLLVFPTAVFSETACPWEQRADHPVSADAAEQIVWQIPEVQSLAHSVRAKGAKPFTMVECPGGELHQDQFFIYFGEELGTHTVRIATFEVDGRTGKVSIYEAVTDKIISLEERQAAQEPVIVMERTMCYGYCPVYKLSIYRNGTVAYEGKQFVKVQGRRTGSIEKDRLVQLIRDFRRSGFFSLQNAYDDHGMTDMPTVILSFTDHKTTKTITHYQGDQKAPKQLFTMEQQVDTITNSRQWTGASRKKTVR